MSQRATDQPSVQIVEVPALDRRVKVFRCGGIVDSFAVVTDRYLVIVDTLISPETAAQVMYCLEPDLEGRQLLVVNTHGDWDHTWGNALFDGPRARWPAPIIGHAATRRDFDHEKALAWLDQSRSERPGWYDAVKFRLPAVEFEGRLVIHGGDLKLQLMPTPGHTADHVSVWIPELRVLMAGDGAEMPMPFISERSSLPVLRESLKAMLAHEPEVVLYCHGGGFDSPELIRHNISYFDEVERRCRHALASGMSVDKALAKCLHWPMEDAMPAEASLDDADTIAFYRASHERAIAAMARWIAGTAQAAEG